MSIRQEHEQELIQKSIRIDERTGKAVARLAFIDDPVLQLKPNKNVAIKRGENVCKRYSSNQQAVKMICKGLQKLIDRSHVIPLEDLNDDQRSNILNSKSSYFIPWDVAFKSGSLTTPSRCVFDASSRTPGGSSLNEILAKGNAD